MGSEITKEKTAIHNEQQFNTIAKNIIKILADESLTIDEADRVLRMTSLQIRQQIITSC